VNVLEALVQIGLTEQNSVVIGSGILGALGIRESHDIDLVVTPQAYARLGDSGQFKPVTGHHDSQLLADDVFEIGPSWSVFGRDHTYEDLLPESVVIGGVRYLTLNFLLRVKESWLHDEPVRPKDIYDVALIKDYLASS